MKVQKILFSLTASLVMFVSSQQSLLSAKECASRDHKWRYVFFDHFNGKKVNKKIWNIAADDSTGGFNNALSSYNGNATNNIAVKHGNLEITAKAEWYVQPIGCKNQCGADGAEPDPTLVARPYTSGALNTYGKVDIDLGKPGLIEARFQVPDGIGLWPAIWMYPKQEVYGGWSASGEIDIMELWRKPDNSNPRFNNYPRCTMWWGGTFPDNALLFAIPVSVDPTGWHTVQFSWDGKGTFVWKLDGLVNFIVGPKEYKVRSVSDPSSPLVPFAYGPSYIYPFNPAQQLPYQGTYVGHYDPSNPPSNVTVTHPSPAPFDASNPYWLIIEWQVGGNPFTDIAPDNSLVFDAGNAISQTTPTGVLSNYEAEQIGLPQRPAAYFTNDQTLRIDYVKYAVKK